MTGYVRKDTTNNIADGNVINAADLDSEFDGVQAAFNSSTGHTHDGSASEGAPITKLGPVQDVTISTTVLGVKTTNTVDLGTSSLKFKDFYLAGAASIGGTLSVTGIATLTAQPILSSLTASQAVFTDASKGLVSNAITGTGNVVMSASPTLTGTITAAAANFSGAVAFNGTTTIGDADTDTITQAASYVTGTQLKSAKTATNTLSLAAYDVDGAAYTNLITLTASNTPTLALTSTGVGTINNMSIGATTASTGAFTTLSATGDITQSSATARITYSSASGNGGLQNDNASAYLLLYGSTHATLAKNIALNSNGGSISLKSTGTDIAVATSTGLAVTGKITVTGDTTNYGILSTNPSGYGAFSLKSATVNQTWSFIANDNGANSDLLLYGGSSAGTKLTLDSSGNLGLGVTPSAWISVYKGLQINEAFFGSQNNAQVAHVQTNTFVNSAGDYKYIATNYASRYRQFNGQHEWYNAPSGTAGNTVTFTQAMTLDASGLLAIGRTTAYDSNALLTLEKSNVAASVLNSTTNGVTLINVANGLSSVAYTGTASNHPFSIYTNGNERARIDSSGNLLVGTTSTLLASNRKLNVFGTAGGTISATGTGGEPCLEAWQQATSGNNVFHQFFTETSATSRGSITYNRGLGQVSYNITSDQRIKTNVTPANSALQSVVNFPVDQYDLIESGNHVNYGVVAQKAINFIPEMVTVPEKEEDLWVVDWSKAVPRMVKAIQEQQALITTLTARITALESA